MWMKALWVLVPLFIPRIRAYLSRDDPLWPSSEIWQQDLESKLSSDSSLTFVEDASTKYIDECEALGDNPYDLAGGGDGVCLQAHFCARKFCKPDLFGFDLPAAVLDVRTPEDIIAGLEFAASHKIAVSVKTTGHSYQGSSTAKDSLMIWMFYYPKDDTITKNYQNSCGTAFDAVLGIGGGEIFDDTLEAFKGDYHAVTGSCRTVSAAGGWLQGVGLSWTSRHYGVGVDNVVDFDVVLPNGTFAQGVDACNEPDLFWALRGGGGGTFG